MSFSDFNNNNQFQPQAFPQSQFSNQPPQQQQHNDYSMDFDNTALDLPVEDTSQNSDWFAAQATPGSGGARNSYPPTQQQQAGGSMRMPNQRQSMPPPSQQAQMQSPFGNNPVGGNYSQPQQQQQIRDPFMGRRTSSSGSVSKQDIFGGGGNVPQQQQGAFGNMNQNINQFNPNEVFKHLPNDPLLRSAAMMGVNQVQGTLSKYLPGVAILWSLLQYHFNVNNKYVVNKLKLILFPFRQKTWSRERSQGDMSDSPRYAPPIADIHAPDLYIPVMSFITYTLLIGLLKGTNMKFTPEVLNDTFNSSMATQLFEIFVMKMGLYLLANSQINLALMDLMIYTGYKYVGVAINMVIGITLGSTAYYMSLAYTCACSCFFMFKTMEKVVPEPGMDQGGRKRRLYFLGMVAVLQVLTIYYLGYATELHQNAPVMDLPPVIPVEKVPEIPADLERDP